MPTPKDTPPPPYREQRDRARRALLRERAEKHGTTIEHAAKLHGWLYLLTDEWPHRAATR